MAEAMGKPEERLKTYTRNERSNTKTYYDPRNANSCVVRFRNTWFAPFDPYEVNFNYTEANSWQYSFYVPQDVSGFMSLTRRQKIQLEAQVRYDYVIA